MPADNAASEYRCDFPICPTNPCEREGCPRKDRARANTQERADSCSASASSEISTEALPTLGASPGNAASTKRRYWLCPKCGFRNERVKQRCGGLRVLGHGESVRCGGRRPKRRVPAHARTLRDDPYPTYAAVNEAIHGVAFSGEWTPDCCGVCGKPPTSARHMDRDHDHTTGLPRGLACPGNQGCNALMPRQMTLERARQVVGYLERVEAYRASQGLTEA